LCHLGGVVVFLGLVVNTPRKLHSAGPKKRDYPSVYVGKIRDGAKAYQPMSLKDAWDKVIHAETVHFDYKVPKHEFHCRHITNSVELKGKYRREAWTVVIDLKKYIRHSIAAFR